MLLVAVLEHHSFVEWLIVLWMEEKITQYCTEGSIASVERPPIKCSKLSRTYQLNVLCQTLTDIPNMSYVQLETMKQTIHKSRVAQDFQLRDHWAKPRNPSRKSFKCNHNRSHRSNTRSATTSCIRHHSGSTC